MTAPKGATLPIVLREGTPAHRAYVRGAWVLGAFAVLSPLLAAELGLGLASLDQPARIGQLNTVIAFAVAILGLDLVIGFSGQLSLGQSAFVGLGAYTTVILVADHHWSFYLAVPATAVVCFLGGLVVGIPATRVRGVYLAIVTLVLASTFPSMVVRFDWLTGGSNGKGTPRTEGRLRPPSWMPFADTGRLAGPLWVYCLSLVLASVLFVLARNLVRSRPGRAMITIRDHERVAVAAGVHVAWYKAMAFGASAAYGGLAGAMLMMNRPFATDGLFNPRMSIFLVAALVIGGTGTITGAIPGAIAYVFVPFFLTQWAFDQHGLPDGVRVLTRPLFALLRPAGGDAGAIFFGSALILLTFVLPGGFVAGVRRWRARFVTVVPHPPWLDGHVARPAFAVTTVTTAGDRSIPSSVDASVGDDVERWRGPGPALTVPDVVPSGAPRGRLDGEDGASAPIPIVARRSGDPPSADRDAMWRRP